MLLWKFCEVRNKRMAFVLINVWPLNAIRVFCIVGGVIVLIGTSLLPVESYI